MVDAVYRPSGQAERMTRPQTPTSWHPDLYVVDGPNKVVWHQGSHAFAMSLNGGKAKHPPLGHRRWVQEQDRQMRLQEVS